MRHRLSGWLRRGVAAAALALALFAATAAYAGFGGATYVPFDKFFATSGTQVVPPNVYRLYVDGCSGGGAGSDTTSGSNFAGGGGTGAACLIHYPLPVTPGQVLTITVGAAGNGASGTSGTVTSISGTNINFPFLAPGVGAGVSGPSTTGASAGYPGTTGGASPANLGDGNVLGPLVGGAGAGNGANSGVTAPGGSGLFPGGLGNSTANPASGPGGASAFGAGGAGVVADSAGRTGTGYGCGGSGGAQFGGDGPYSGGNGCPAFVHLSTQ